jgi:hypothetical protein
MGIGRRPLSSPKGFSAAPSLGFILRSHLGLSYNLLDFSPKYGIIVIDSQLHSFSRAW